MVNLDNYRLRSEINDLKNRIADLEETIQLMLSFLGLGITSDSVKRVLAQNLKNKEIHKDVDC